MAERQPFLTFPGEFLWGAATSAFQIEGGFDEDGKKPSIWDIFSHERGRIRDNTNADIACDHYHRYKADITLMKEQIGIKAYRFSISWPRIMPDGKGKINLKGIDFYKGIIDELLKNGIVPFVTLYHWDLPAVLQKRGGWMNRDTVACFREYAQCIVKAFGDRVKYWITINEPAVITAEGYITGNHAPGERNILHAVRVAHNLLLAHAGVYADIKSSLPDLRVGIANHYIPVYSGHGGSHTVLRKVNALFNRLFTDPLFTGDYPDDLKKYIYLLNHRISRNDMALIHKSCDFLGVNYYTRKIIKRTFLPFPLYREFRGKFPGSEYTDMEWEVYPEGLFDIVQWIREEYRNPPVYITENGAAFKDRIAGNKVNDSKRINYLKAHIAMLHKALRSGCDIRGYFVWSLLDNFEWTYGTSRRFGLVYIDFKSHQRIVKASGHWYSGLCRNHAFQP